jgi:hypothetical protein
MLRIPTSCNYSSRFIEASLPRSRYNWDYEDKYKLVDSLYRYLHEHHLDQGHGRSCMVLEEVTVQEPTPYEALFLVVSRLLVKGHCFKGLCL